ncbi:MAG: glycoside hydrolase family 28 protein [Muribaculaceae bacterium]|nr:glycoside hydrolase family 28 protein [Muribaculaceae bacterium]
MTLKSILAASLVAMAPALTAWSAPQASNEFASMYENLPFEMPVVERPVIPDYTVSIKDFGGVNDGKTKNTEAFAKAMAHLAQKGGGHLVVPEGIWYTGPIVMESNVDLHLMTGSLILFSEDLSDYPVTPSFWEGNSAHRCQSPLSANGKTNISVTGNGTINGNGNAWRPVKKMKMTSGQWSALTAGGALGSKGDVWYPNESVKTVSENLSMVKRAEQQPDNKALWDSIHDFLRPVLVGFVSCKNVLLEGPCFENSPAWNIHPMLCENLIINNITVRNPWYAQNGDGLDAESCKNVIVSNCKFDVGDDAICIKSGKDKEGRDRGVPCENVIIEGCTVYHGHGGFVIGSEMSGGARNISIRNSVFIGTDCGLRFKSARGRGGVVEKIWVDGIKMVNIDGDAFTFDLYYGGKGEATMMPVTEETPSFRDITVTNTICRGAKRAMFFNGIPEMPVMNLYVGNSTFDADKGAILNYVDTITLDNVTINAVDGDPIETNHVNGLVIK